MKTKKTLLVCCIITGICSLFLSIPSCKKAVIPTINTTDISEVYSITAVCGGDITSDGGADITESGVCWSTMGVPTISDSKKTSESTSGKFKITIKNLTPGTTYQLRAYAINDAGVAYGNVKIFTTTFVPAVVTNPVTNIEKIEAQCGGTVSSSISNIFTRGICWSSVNTTPTISSHKSYSGDGNGTYTCTMWPLQPATTYYVRAFAENSEGVGYGEILTFTTETGTVPTLATDSVIQITPTSASCFASITDEGGYALSARGIIWSTSNNFDLSNAMGNIPYNHSFEHFSCEISGLSPNVTYYFKAYGTNEIGTSYGNQLSLLLTE